MYEMKKAERHRKKTLQASFTIESAMVLGVIFFTFSALIRHAFTLHDTVTGTMILSEVLDAARYDFEGENVLQELEERGTKLGDLGLWLGKYEINMQEGSDGIAGAAAAGEWMTRIDLKKSRPADVLRGIAAVEEIGGFLDVGSGIQERNESELPDPQTGEYAK